MCLLILDRFLDNLFFSLYDVGDSVSDNDIKVLIVADIFELLLIFNLHAFQLHLLDVAV